MPEILKILTCPVCGSPLAREDGSLKCENRHTFDVARSGYVNMLPPGKARNAKSGDDAGMVRARRTFLFTGKYDRLSDGVAKLISESAPERDLVTVVDSGCGEGYHSCRIARGVAASRGKVLLAGFDASKTAAEAASKLAKSLGMAGPRGIGDDFAGDAEACFMTGNIFSLPIREGSVSAVVSMFAPIAWEESARMLTDGGVVVIAASGTDHLIEMRSLIYDEVIKKETDGPSVPADFEMIRHRNVKYPFTLEGEEEIMALFGMTPFCYRAPAAGVERLRGAGRLDITADVDLYVCRKK